MTAAFTFSPIPTSYAGVRYRSRLEADWAATFDHLGWHAAYEAEGVQLPRGRYLPDFWLPTMRTFVEVKGPHDERLNKTAELAEAVAEWGIRVVVARPPAGMYAAWEGVRKGQDWLLRLCPSCEHYDFVDLDGDWGCARCHVHSKPLRCDTRRSADAGGPHDGLLEFFRVPRWEPH